MSQDNKSANLCPGEWVCNVQTDELDWRINQVQIKRDKNGKPIVDRCEDAAKIKAKENNYTPDMIKNITKLVDDAGEVNISIPKNDKDGNRIFAGCGETRNYYGNEIPNCSEYKPSLNNHIKTNNDGDELYACPDSNCKNVFEFSPEDIGQEVFGSKQIGQCCEYKYPNDIPRATYDKSLGSIFYTMDDLKTVPKGCQPVERSLRKDKAVEDSNIFGNAAKLLSTVNTLMENESKLDAASLKNSQSASSSAFNEGFTNMTPYNKELDDMCYGGLGVSDGYHKITNKFNTG